MLIHSILAFSLFVVSDASSLTKRSDPDCDRTNGNVLGPKSELHVTSSSAAPDGHLRPVPVYNGEFIAPLIQAKKGDEFRVKLVNELTDDNMPLLITTHYHGIRQKGSAWADGATSVTQCPVRQNGSFVQIFKTGEQTGTYWYHAHNNFYYCAGLRGPLVIYDPEDPMQYLYDVDDENTVITLADWYHSPDVPSKRFGLPNSTLINGRGRYQDGPLVPLSVVNVKPGLRYRIRVVAMTCESAYTFSIDNHTMTIIEVDGNAVLPTNTDTLFAVAGQRFSVVIQADQPIGNYWIRAMPNRPNSTFDGGQNLAILRYEGAPDEDPTSSPGPYELLFDETKLHAYADPTPPGIPEIGKADVNLRLAPGFNPQALQFTFGGASFAPPTVPVLLQILSGINPSELLPKESIYTVPRNKVVEISIPEPNKAPGTPHSIHLHGQSFYVVRSAGSNFTNFVNPVRRDSVSTGSDATDEVVIRFRTDDPGPWLIHCHLDVHFAHGFAAVIVAAEEETAEEEAQVVPEDWKDLCNY